ncbi:MAG: alpha/beta hydrolase [Tannerella sp.]|jgi:acetyl esterase/lipase|nr:alpha/beta hydrolase [Tannerella sp.]
MKQLIFTCLLMFGGAMTADAQQVIKLWAGNPPTDNEITAAENEDANHWITNVSSPELTVFLPEKGKGNGKAVVVCPGGGYAGLASHHEGTLVARWLAGQGIAAFILKYRMPNRHREVPLEDAQQAIRYVRSHAGEWQIQPDRIGIAGFSAGGHLASTASTHFSITDGVSSRPDFTLLFYPVITMEIATHAGSRNNLLGDQPSPADLYTFSNEKQVNVNTPPAIILLSDDDRAVLPENSIRYYQALKANGIKSALYIFPVGGHGWGWNEDFAYHRQVLELLAAWLEDI